MNQQETQRWRNSGGTQTLACYLCSSRGGERRGTQIESKRAVRVAAHMSGSTFMSGITPKTGEICFRIQAR
jgi:hypothetical protein